VPLQHFSVKRHSNQYIFNNNNNNNLANTIELVLPSAYRVHNPNGKSIGSAVVAQLAAECHTDTLATRGKYDSVYASFGPSESTTQVASRLVQPFLHSSQQKVPILYSGMPIPLKIAPSDGGSGPPSNTWFPGPTRVLKPNSILIDSADFAGLTSVTDRQTDRPYMLLSQ